MFIMNCISFRTDKGLPNQLRTIIMSQRHIFGPIIDINGSD